MTATNRHLVVDGSNIATEGRTLPSLAQLEDAVIAVASQRGFSPVTVIVDATFGHRIPKTESKAFEKRLLDGKMLTPPAGAVGRGDAFILEVADRANATVLSNDSFQEFHGEYGWLFDEERLIGGKPVPGVGWVFVNRMPVRGPTSRKATSDKSKADKNKADKKPSTKKKIGDQDKSRSKKSRDDADAKDSSKSSSKSKEKQAQRSAKKRDRPEEKKSKKRDGDAVEELNSTTAFLTFVTKFSIGDEFVAIVERFASHGCYVQAATAQCYLPSKSMGNPPPAKARDVVSRGDEVRVRVVSLDSARRGINVELVGVSRVAGDNQQSTTVSKSSPRRSNDSAGDYHLTRSERHVATKKAAKKAPAKKAVKKAAPKKAAKKARPRRQPRKLRRRRQPRKPRPRRQPRRLRRRRQPRRPRPRRQPRKLHRRRQPRKPRPRRQPRKLHRRRQPRKPRPRKLHRRRQPRKPRPRKLRRRRQPRRPRPRRPERRSKSPFGLTQLLSAPALCRGTLGFGPHDSAGRICTMLEWLPNTSTPCTKSVGFIRRTSRCWRTSACPSTRAPKLVSSGPTELASHRCSRSWRASTTATPARPGSPPDLLRATWNKSRNWTSRRTSRRTSWMGLARRLDSWHGTKMCWPCGPSQMPTTKRLARSKPTWRRRSKLPRVGISSEPLKSQWMRFVFRQPIHR